MTEIAAEKTSTMIIPLPMELMRFFTNMNSKMEGDAKDKEDSNKG
jgi:hypothetical protein